MDTTTSLGEIAVSHPGAARIFRQHRLDFCCGGKRSLGDACRDRQLDADAILRAIEAEQAVDEDARRWDTAPLPDLIDHIVGVYHARLRRALPDLIAMARRVEARHGDKPECPTGLASHLERMHEAVLEHLLKEEHILFPLIASGRGAHAAAPVHVMELEHADHGTDLATTRALTDDLQPPAAACTTWRALYLGLAQLEQELTDHIHLENNILFPRALA